MCLEAGTNVCPTTKISNMMLVIRCLTLSISFYFIYLLFCESIHVFVLFQVTQFAVLCYGSPRTLVHLRHTGRPQEMFGWGCELGGHGLQTALCACWIPSQAPRPQRIAKHCSSCYRAITSVNLLLPHLALDEGLEEVKERLCPQPLTSDLTKKEANT